MSGRSFGELVIELRHKKGLTIKELIEKLKAKGQERVTPAYITRIEQYGEIPSPEMICRMADVFDYDVDKLLDCAQKIKVRRFDESLAEKYRKAVGLYKKEKT